MKEIGISKAIVSLIKFPKECPFPNNFRKKDIQDCIGKKVGRKFSPWIQVEQLKDANGETKCRTEKESSKNDYYVTQA